MVKTHDSEIFPRIVVALLVALSSAGMWSIARAVWQGDDLSSWEQLMIGSMITLAVVGIIYVLIQKVRMSESETFRREKW